MRSLSSEETRDALRAYGLDRPAGIGFGFLDRARNTVYDWHTHDYHQLIHAIDAPTQIETMRGRYVLTTGRAAWIPAGTRHRTLVSERSFRRLFEKETGMGWQAWLGQARIMMAMGC